MFSFKKIKNTDHQINGSQSPQGQIINHIADENTIEPLYFCINTSHGLWTGQFHYYVIQTLKDPVPRYGNKVVLHQLTEKQTASV